MRGNVEEVVPSEYLKGTICEELAPRWYLLEDGEIFYCDCIEEFCDPVELTPAQQRTVEKIEVMEAFVRGGEIECVGSLGALLAHSPKWDWGNFEYRVAPKDEPDTPLDIPWEYIDDNWVCAAMDEDGAVYLYNTSDICLAYAVKDLSAWTWPDDKSVTNTDTLKIKTDGINWRKSKTLRPSK